MKRFCRRAGINVAGLDILFSGIGNPGTPLFLEINYYFGRRGLGGSLRFYELLEQAADRWLAAGESRKPGPPKARGPSGFKVSFSIHGEC